MQAQTTRTFGRNPIISTAIGIGLLAASVFGIATLSDSVELPSLGTSSNSIERPVESPGPVQSYSFREANLYHPGFESRPASVSSREVANMRLNAIIPEAAGQAIARPAIETAFIEQNLALPGLDSQATVRSALETAFLELNLAMPEYQERGEVRSAEETIFIEWNTIRDPEANDSTDSVEVKANQPS